MLLIAALEALNIDKVEISEGDYIINEGSPGAKVYVLAEGKVGVTVKGDLVAEADAPGTVFGEIANICSQPYSASVKTLSNCKFYVIDNFVSFLRQHPDEMFIILEQLCRKIVATNQKYLQLLE